MLRRVANNRQIRKQAFTQSCALVSTQQQTFTTTTTTQLFSDNKFSHNNNNQSFFTNIAGKQFKVNIVQKRSYASLPSGLNEVKMPALSPTMDKGTIVNWRLKEGDKITAGTVLCEIETDKAKLEFEFPEEAYLAKILKPNGSQDVAVGEVIAIIGDSPADVSKASSITLESLASASASAPQQQQQTSAPQQSQQPQQSESSSSVASSIPQGVSEIKMPALSPTMTKGNISRWIKKEGDKLSPGDVLCEVETDKATIEFEFQEEGYLAKILAPEGTKDVELFSVIALLAEDKDAVSRAASYTPGAASSSTAPQTAKQPAQQTSAPQQQTQQPVQKTSGGRVFASPLAKKIASETGVDLAAIGNGSGPNGRIIKNDVDAFVASGKQAQQQQPARAQQQQQQQPQPTRAGAVETGEFTDIPVSSIRRVIANRLVESKQTVPHYYLSVECEVDALMKIRAQLNKYGEKRGYKLSVNDFIIKAAASAMKKVPEVNSSWRGDYIRQFNNVDVSVAVETSNGLITPIVFNAEGKGLSEISNSVKSLAEKARTGKLQPQEFQGGTFTISNLGMFGVNNFSAIINPPQACILAVGSGQQKVVPNDVEGGEKFKVVTAIQFTLSCDHRVVDGAVGARWLQEFKALIENPVMLLL